MLTSFYWAYWILVIPGLSYLPAEWQKPGEIAALLGLFISFVKWGQPLCLKTWGWLTSSNTADAKLRKDIADLIAFILPNGGNSLSDQQSAMRRDLAALISANEVTNHRIHTICSFLPMVTFETTPTGEFIYISNQIVQWLRRDKSEMLGNNWQTLIKDEDYRRVTDSWYSCLSHRSRFLCDFRFCDITGTSIPVSMDASPVPSEDGNMGYSGKIMRVDRDTDRRLDGLIDRLNLLPCQTDNCAGDIGGTRNTSNIDKSGNTGNDKTKEK